MTRYFICILLYLSNCLIHAKSVGENTYGFLDLTNSARVASLGGQQISIFDDDLNMAFHNPSLLNGSMSDRIVLNYVPYVGDIGYGYFSYAKTFNKIGNLGVGIHYIDYGDFTGADEYGNLTSDFGAKEYSLNFYYSRPVFDSLLHFGGTLKYINSHLESYRSWGIAVDAGFTYTSKDRLFGAALVMKNLGAQMTTYYDGADREPLPFEIQLGLSQKLEHAPFRFSVTFRHLETPNLRYETEVDEKADSSFVSNILRHTVFGLEFLPSKYLSFQIGYNYRRRQELKIPEEKAGFIGFSWGVGLKLKNISINYGRVRYHFAGISNHISVSVNLAGFKKT